MARPFTIARLIRKGRRACAQENSDLLSPAEWQDELSSVLSEFQSAIVDGGARVFEDTATITATGVSDYDLPVDFLAELGVDYNNGGDREQLRGLVVQERNCKQNAVGHATHFAIVNDSLRLYPTPATGGVYYLVYIPQAPDYSEIVDTTEVDVIVPAGEQFFKWSLAAIGAAKEESDNTPYYEQKAAQAREKLVEWSYKRSMTQPHRKIVDDAGEHQGDDDWYSNR